MSESRLQPELKTYEEARDALLWKAAESVVHELTRLGVIPIRVGRDRDRQIEAVHRALEEAR